MDPSKILFDAVGNLTGGLITDLQTAMIGVVTVLFLMMGGDLLKDVFIRRIHRGEEVSESDVFDSDWEAARYYKRRARTVLQGSVEYDLAMARYKKHLKNLI